MLKELIRILPPAYRRRGLRVAATLLVRAVLNLAGLAALLPALALVLDPSWTTTAGPLARAYALSGLSSPRTFALALCGGVVAVVGTKCLINYLLAQAEHRYIYSLYRTLSRRLFVAYHDRGLAFIKGTNSALLARNVNVVCLAFVSGILRPAASMAAEGMLLVLLIAALAAYAPLAALLAVAVFLPAAWLYFTLVRKRIARYGELENKAQREKARLVAETFRGYADIEINDAFPMMLRTFDRAMDRVIDNRRREAALWMLPQTFTEVGLAVGMALLVALSLGRGAADARLLFGVFAVAALRLMPSVRSIMAGWASIRYNRYTIDILRDAPTATAPAEPDDGRTLPFEREIAVRGLSFRFEDDGSELFRDLSLTIRKGERVGIRGASGAGKTTLFNLLLGLYEPAAGRIEIDGVPLTRSNRRAWQRRIGYVSQHLFLADATFAENVALGTPAEEIDRRRAAEALEAAQLGAFIASLPDGMDTRVGECGCRLSGGQRQRIGIARALYRRSDVLFFDEATSALDSRTEEQVNRAIAALAASHPGLTLVAIAHRESSLEYCDRIITLGE
ncbi:ATP-binding cassette domain-containing protein [Alistipes sp.]|uniref:ATP-binding cassette domain-containing protein n=1 Tax=Alistipes sp. TaxID=1872444 RepID=UPI003AF01811